MDKADIIMVFRGSRILYLKTVAREISTKSTMFSPSMATPMPTSPPRIYPGIIQKVLRAPMKLREKYNLESPAANGI